MDSILRDKLNRIGGGEQDAKLGDQIALSQSLYGKAWFLDPTLGDDGNDGTAPDKAFKTFAVAYAALTANKNEVLYHIGGSSSIQVTAGFEWAKSYTHYIGISAGGPYGRSRFGHTGSNHVVSLFTITANGCIFKNIHWQMGNGHAENLNCVVLSATTNYCYFENCHFDAPLNATEGAAAYCCLYMTALARSNSFKGCWFGDWTAGPTSTSGCLVNLVGTNAGTQFEDCVFIINTSQSTLVPIKAAADQGGGNPPGYIWFRNCDFLALSTGVSVACTAPTTGKIVLSNCRAVGVTAWAASSNNVLIACGTETWADGGGLGVVQS